MTLIMVLNTNWALKRLSQFREFDGDSNAKYTVCNSLWSRRGVAVKLTRFAIDSPYIFANLMTTPLRVA